MSILKKLRERAEPMNVAELAAMLVVTAATVQRWVRHRQIPCVRIADTIRFDPDMLAEWIEVQSACTNRLLGSVDPSPNLMRLEDLAELAAKEFVPRPPEKA